MHMTTTDRRTKYLWIFEIVSNSVSDPGHFYTENENENTDPDPSNYISDFFSGLKLRLKAVILISMWENFLWYWFLYLIQNWPRYVKFQMKETEEVGKSVSIKGKENSYTEWTLFYCSA